MPLSYQAIVTEVKMAGPNAVISAAVPGAAENELYLNVSAVVPMDIAKTLHIGDAFAVTFGLQAAGPDAKAAVEREEAG